MRLIISLGISSPISLRALSKLNLTWKSSIFFGYISTISLVISPPATSCINIAAHLSAYSVIFGSIPLSNLKDASVLSAWRLADFLMLTGLKYALSKKILVVFSVTPESAPPKTPAIHIGFSALQIIKSSSCNSRSIPSKVVNFVPFSKVFTIILLPTTFEASKACNG